jgi:hypothetical protein
MCGGAAAIRASADPRHLVTGIDAGLGGKGQKKPPPPGAKALGTLLDRSDNGKGLCDPRPDLVVGTNLRGDAHVALRFKQQNDV